MRIPAWQHWPPRRFYSWIAHRLIRACDTGRPTGDLDSLVRRYRLTRRGKVT